MPPATGGEGSRGGRWRGRNRSNTSGACRVLGGRQRRPEMARYAGQPRSVSPYPPEACAGAFTNATGATGESQAPKRASRLYGGRRLHAIPECGCERMAQETLAQRRQHVVAVQRVGGQCLGRSRPGRRFAQRGCRGSGPAMERTTRSVARRESKVIAVGQELRGGGPRLRPTPTRA
jgi:hypothetical protein